MTTKAENDAYVSTEQDAARFMLREHGFELYKSGNWAWKRPRRDTLLVVFGPGINDQQGATTLAVYAGDVDNIDGAEPTELHEFELLVFALAFADKK